MVPIAAPATKDVLALLRRDELTLDALMVPQSMGAMATLLRSDFPDVPLRAHLSASLSDPSPLPGSVTDAIVEFVRLAETEWVSAHLGYNCSDVVRSAACIAPTDKAQRYVPVAARRTIVTNIKLLGDLFGKPMTLENLPAVGRSALNSACDYVCDPGFIGDVLEAADCGLLLDLAHARITAAHRGVETITYLERLPLDRVAELHVSGPREVDGVLCDVHGEPQLADFELLDWVLGRCRPKLVTVECAVERPRIAEQLERVRRACKRKTD
jgi:hypothetical protein